MLVKFLGLTEQATRAPVFTDVPPDAWYYGCVQAAVEAGLVKGYANKEFHPAKSITREEMTVMLVRALGRENEARAKGGETLNFADAGRIAPWAKGFIAIAVEEGLISGYPDNTFRPQRNATRAETAAMVCRFLKKI